MSRSPNITVSPGAQISLYVQEPKYHCISRSLNITVCPGAQISLYVQEPKYHCISRSPNITVCPGAQISLYVQKPKYHCISKSTVNEHPPPPSKFPNGAHMQGVAHFQSLLVCASHIPHYNLSGRKISPFSRSSGKEATLPAPHSGAPM
jgi:hypothetical protein